MFCLDQYVSEGILAQLQVYTLKHYKRSDDGLAVKSNSCAPQL